MRLGVYGGTFDPPHVGHLLVASDAAEALELDRLLFVPAATQPFKVGAVTATAAERLAMVRLLAGAEARFAVDPVEIDREGLSYTVETLAAFAARWPHAQRFLLIGADVLPTFADWREPARVLSLARLVILRRGVGATGTDVTGGEMETAELVTAHVSGGTAPPPIVLATRRVDVSSTEVRARVRAGRPIRGFVPDDVAEYIAARGLYR